MSFVPRTSFPFPARAPSWFAGHMRRGLDDMTAQLSSIDVVIEARDSRLPLSSINPAFEDMLQHGWSSTPSSSAPVRGRGRVARGYSMRGRGGISSGGGTTRERIIVYTKRDIAEQKYEKPLTAAFQKHAGQKVVFIDTRVDRDVRKILDQIVSLAKDNPETMPEIRVLIVGMPNVGKSSLLNALRRVGVNKGKAAKVGAQAGITKKVTGTVRVSEDPPVYVYDTPGVMMPFFGKGDRGSEAALKLALTHGIKESLFDLEVVVDYLLFRLNLRDAKLINAGQADKTFLASFPTTATSAFQKPTNDCEGLLIALARRIGALHAGAEPDTEAAARWFIKAFREGSFGRWTIDGFGGFGGDRERKEADELRERFEIAEERAWLAKQRGEDPPPMPAAAAIDSSSSMLKPEPPVDPSLMKLVDERVGRFLLAQTRRLQGFQADLTNDQSGVQQRRTIVGADGEEVPEESMLSRNQMKKQLKAIQKEVRDAKWAAKGIVYAKGGQTVKVGLGGGPAEVYVRPRKGHGQGTRGGKSSKGRGGKR
uniref:G domain-containing protein n=1 Tax=Bartheletia paradoxa TaxID=669517 RepID=A0A2D0XHV2_9BASI|nr:hypothetical protein SPAR06837 [Bartheletia paradoxa]